MQTPHCLQGKFPKGAGFMRMQHSGCIDLGGRLNHAKKQHSHDRLRCPWCAPALVDAPVDAPVTAVTLGPGGQRVSWKCWMAATALSRSVPQDDRGFFLGVRNWHPYSCSHPTR